MQKLKTLCGPGYAHLSTADRNRELQEHAQSAGVEGFPLVVYLEYSELSKEWARTCPASP